MQTHNDALAEAVNALTNDREITTIIKGDSGEWLGYHDETHPPLLTLLIEGTGFSRGPKSSEEPLPIDADALEMWGQVRDMTRVWCKQLRVPLSDDLNESVRRWHSAHVDALRAGRIGEGTDQDVTRMVEGWVRMIESKFDPSEKREWQDRCVAVIDYVDEAGESTLAQCGARRIVLNGSEVFAIEINVTTETAMCRACGSTWVGIEGLSELRYLTNLDSVRASNEVTNPDACKASASRI